MKIAQIILSSGTGGAEKSFIDLCNALAPSAEIVAIILAGTDYADRFHEKVKVHQLGSGSGRLNPFLHIEIARLLWKEQPDIVHTHTAKATEIVHRLIPFVPGQHVATKRNDRRGRIFDQVDNVIAISDRVANSIRGNHATVIYNGIDAMGLAPRPRKNSRFTLCAIGRLEPIKGFDRLIEAVAGLGFEFQLRIYGEGPERRRLETLIEDLDLRHRVTLMGYVEQIPQALQAADLVVVSSHREGFNRVLIEAIHYAPMLISTPVGVAEELLSEEFLMDPGEIGQTIERIHDDYARYQALFERLKTEQRDRFSKQAMIDAHITYYKTVSW